MKNIGLLTLSSFATKLLSFFLVPLYTNILTTTDYGTYDLFNTTIGVLLPILTLNIQAAVMRFALDKKYNREALITVSIRYLLISCAVVFAALGINHVLSISETLNRYALFFFLMYFVQALSGIVIAYIRGIDKITELSISSVIASTISIICNILFLVVFKWGLAGYFLANLVGSFVQCTYLIIQSHMIRGIYLNRSYKAEKNEMLEYSRPMIANSIAWWVNNASDRYVVIFFCGLAENGIYSVASKIPSILNILQSIFAQAWTLSAVKDFDSEDKNGFFSNTYKAYNCIMVMGCSVIIVTDKILAKILYAKDFYVAWKYVPWLTIAIVFGSLSGYIGGIFSAVKDSKIYAQSTIVGAVSNIALNIILTPIIGALGAAIATTVCYVVVWSVRYRHVKRYIMLKINIFRDIVSYILLGFQAVCLLAIPKDYILYGLEVTLFFVIVVLYNKEIMQMFNKLFKKRGVI
jgi:O-antigen/teichoic acid export membrane protein